MSTASSNRRPRSDADDGNYTPECRFVSEPSLTVGYLVENSGRRVIAPAMRTHKWSELESDKWVIGLAVCLPIVLAIVLVEIVTLLVG